MSETDDTDALLLIPPDLFCVESELEEIYTNKNFGPYYTVLDGLITHVNKLENRVDYIENTSEISLVNSSLDYSANNREPLMSGTRQYVLENVPRDRYSDSTQSTPVKPRSKYKVNSLPSTPSTERYSPRKFTRHDLLPKSPRKYVPQKNGDNFFTKKSAANDTSFKSTTEPNMLDEIDNFISNVKTIQKLTASKNLSLAFDSGPQEKNHESAKSHLNLKDVDRMLQEMESHQREIEFQLKEKEHELGITKNTEVNENVKKRRTWQPGECKNSVPDYATGMRDIMFGEQGKNAVTVPEQITRLFTNLTVEPLETQELSATDISMQTSESNMTDEKSQSLSSTDSTQLTAFQNYSSQAAGDGTLTSPKSDVIHNKAINVLNLHKKLSKNTLIKPQFNVNSREPVNKNLGLLSLTDLWGSNRELATTPSKLEEEKLRRRHCEQLIQQLQTRTLELQERLAVAIEVDFAKDDAILRFHDAWESVTSKYQFLGQEKSQMEKQLSQTQAKSAMDLREAAKKISHYESEASKALNLAHASQEKLALAEKQCSHVNQEYQALEENCKVLQNKYEAELDKNQTISQLLTQKEIEIDETKSVLTNARKEILDSKRAVELCQAELTSLKTENNQLSLQLQEERSSVKNLDSKNKKLLFDIEMHKKIEKSLQEDLNKAKEDSNNHKVELRNFYQDQVEVVVREKLTEFQDELKTRENTLQNELKNKEYVIAKTAAKHIQQIAEKHSYEVELLEEKHKEEIRLFQLRLSECQQLIQNMQMKFQQQQERRSVIAQQLHRVMEAQWLEAIKIINNGKSPTFPLNNEPNALDQLNLLKSKSYTNLEEILSVKDETENRNPNMQKFNAFSTQSVDSPTSIIDDTNDKYMEFKYGISTETPITSKPRSKPDHDLQKYIQLLLNKSPGQPVEDKNTKNGENVDNTQMSYPNWQVPTHDKANGDGAKGGKTLENRTGKRPWK